MFGKNSAIRKYQKKLPSELTKRYGGKGPYSEGQVNTTVAELGLSKRHIQYAFLLYCEQRVLVERGLDESVISNMLAVVATASAGGIFAVSSDAMFGSGDGDGGGDGGGGGGGGGE